MDVIVDAIHPAMVWSSTKMLILVVHQAAREASLVAVEDLPVVVTAAVEDLPVAATAATAAVAPLVATVAKTTVENHLHAVA